MLRSTPGSQPWYERYIRVFCRQIFLDKASDFVEKGFWLCKILKPWPLVFQARLLYILYGPVNDDNGKWLFWKELKYPEVDLFRLGALKKVFFRKKKLANRLKFSNLFISTQREIHTENRGRVYIVRKDSVYMHYLKIGGIFRWKSRHGGMKINNM